MNPPTPNKLAQASGILGVISLATCGGFLILPIVGLALGLVGLVQISRAGGRQRGTGAAAAGLALSSAAIPMLFISYAYLQPIVERERDHPEMRTCRYNQKQLTLAMLQYAQDYDEWFVAGALSSADAVRAYDCPPEVFVCPADGNGPPSYAYTEVMRGTRVGDLPADTVMLIETDDGKNVAWRHNRKASFGFVDGHVYWRLEARPPFGYESAPGPPSRP